LCGGLNQTAMIATADKTSCARATGAQAATTTKPQHALRRCSTRVDGRLAIPVYRW